MREWAVGRDFLLWIKWKMPRGGRPFGSNRKKTPLASLSPSLADLSWIAGFMEGEASFTFSGTAPQVAVGQVQREPLERLSRWLGGKVHEYKRIHSWKVSGGRARGVMMTMYPFMSPRRKGQIITALTKVNTTALDKFEEVTV